MGKFKLGERITVDVTRAKPTKRAPGTAARDPHYGAIRRIEDESLTNPPPSIQFFDASIRWQDFADDDDLVDDASPLPDGVMCYVQDRDLFIPDLSDFHLNQLYDNMRGNCFNKDSVKLPPFSGTEYRKIDRAQALPTRGIDVLGLSITLNTRTIEIREGVLRKATPAARRLENAQADAHPDEALIARLQHEVHESDFPTGQSICRASIVPQLWFTHAERDQRDLWRDGGFFRPSLAAGRYKLAVTSAIHFEPFDLSDTTNFKITPRLVDPDTASNFDSDEVEPDKLKVGPGARPCKIYLVPQLWRFTVTYTEVLVDRWQNHTTGNNIFVEWTRESSDAGYMPAMSSPWVVSGWETPINALTEFLPSAPQYLHAIADGAYDPTDTSDVSLLRLMMQLSLFRQAAELANPHFITTEPHTDQPPDDPMFGAYDYAQSFLIARTDGVCQITQEGAPQKMFVGAIEFADKNDARFMVWRRVAREIETVTIYNGPCDDPGYYSDVDVETFQPINALKKIQSTAWTGSYAAPRFAWQSGGLCGDGYWPYLMQPRWIS